MIRKIKFSNFYSFYKENTIDLTVNSRTPKNNSYFKSISKDRVTKINVTIGSNASGKTNLLKAVGFISWFAKDSYTRQTPTSNIPLKQFAFSKKPRPSKFFLEVESKEKIYQYKFSVNKNIVISETLKVVFPKKQLVFSRYQYGNQAKYNLKNLGIPPIIIKNNIKKNASLLSLALAMPKNKISDISESLTQFGNTIEQGNVDRLNLVLKELSANPARKQQVIDQIKKFDIGLDDLEISPDSDDGYKLTSYGIHHNKDNSGDTKIPLIYESAGTRHLISIFGIILNSLITGGAAIIDEIDNNIHPLIIPEIVNIFVNPNTNPKNSQLIISTHNTEILNYIDKEQISLVDRTSNGESTTHLLSDIKGVKESDNHFKNYMTGNYGAVPNIQI